MHCEDASGGCGIFNAVVRIFKVDIFSPESHEVIEKMVAIRQNVYEYVDMSIHSAFAIEKLQE